MSSLKFDADKDLLDFVQKKADKLDTFYDQIIDGEVSMKVENSDKRLNKIVEMKVNIPGTTMFAKEKNRSFEAAVDDAVETIRRQMKKHKGKSSR